MIDIRRDKELIIKIEDKLDATNSQDVMDIVSKALEGLNCDIKLDVSKLEYISSAGLQVILKCAKASKSAGKEIYLFGAKGGVLEIFKISGFLTFIKEVE